MLELKKTGRGDYPPHIKALVLGDAKAGKTSFASTFPNLLMADVEGGLMSIAHKNIAYVEVDNTDVLRNLLVVLRDKATRQKAADQLGMPHIESVAIDTLDALQQLLQKERLRAERRTSFKREDWGWLLETMRELVKAYVALPLHVVLTCHTKTTFDEENRLIRAPSLQGAMQDEIAGLVGYSLMVQRSVEVDPQTGDRYTKHFLLTDGDEKNPHLGNRAAGALPRMVEPDFKHLYEVVQENLDRARKDEEEKLQSAIQEAVSESINDQDDEDSGAPRTAPDEQPAAPPQGEDEKAPDAGVAQDSSQTAPTEPAQDSSRPSAPPSDSEELVNIAAKQHLGRIYHELGYELPANIDTWTMLKAREVMRLLVACKADFQSGKESEEEFRDSVYEVLEGLDALDDGVEKVTEVPDVEVEDGADDEPPAEPPPEPDDDRPVEEVIDLTIEGVMEWVAEHPRRAQEAYDLEFAKKGGGRSTLLSKLESLGAKPPEPAPVDERPSERPPETGQPVEPAGRPVDEVGHTPTTEEATALIERELGGTPVEEAPSEATTEPCDECGDELDDPDIANLARIRYRRQLCTSCYISMNRKSKATT